MTAASEAFVQYAAGEQPSRLRAALAALTVAASAGVLAYRLLRPSSPSR